MAESSYSQEVRDPVAIKDCATRMEAEIVKSALAAFGVQSFISGDDCGGQRPSFVTVRRIQVLVRGDDARRAHQVLTSATQL